MDDKEKKKLVRRILLALSNGLYLASTPAREALIREAEDHGITVRDLIMAAKEGLY